MDYWISHNNVQQGPYSLQQLRSMWQQGQLNGTSYYYDNIRVEWLLVRSLLESAKGLFTVEEAFVRLGQNRLKGCLSIFNREEVMHLYVENGFVIYATSKKEQGEFALARALALEQANYEWFEDAKAPAMNLRKNIAEYAAKHSMGRDIPSTGPAARKLNTVAIAKAFVGRTENKPSFNYILVSEEPPIVTLRLPKMNNVVGREDTCDVVVNERQVSRKHCLLEVWEQHVKVKDLDSSNGTFVNGLVVQDGFLKVGDELGLGTYKMILQKEQKKAPSMG